MSKQVRTPAERATTRLPRPSDADPAQPNDRTPAAIAADAAATARGAAYDALGAANRATTAANLARGDAHADQRGRDAHAAADLLRDALLVASRLADLALGAARAATD